MSLRMCKTQDLHIYHKMDDKEQFVREHIAHEQFEAVLLKACLNDPTFHLKFT